MDIISLKKIVKESLKDGLFSLDTSLLKSPSISAIAADNFPNNTLEMTPDTTTPIIEPSDGNTIIAVGIGITPPFTQLHLQAKFYLINQNAALMLSATADPAWNLSRSFPLFQKNLGAAILFAPTPTFYLLSDPSLGRNSGLSFEGIIDLSNMSGGLSELLGILNQPIKGPIVLKNGASQFQSIELVGPEITKVNFWIAKDCSVQFKIANYLLPNPFFKSYAAIPYIEMNAAIPFSAQGKSYSLPISTRVTNFDSDIRFEADLSHAIDAALEEISALANNAGLSGILPPPSSFPIEKILKLSDLYFDYNPTSKSLSCISLEVQSASCWTILHIPSTGKVLTAQNVRLDFSVMTPFSSPSPYINISGDISLTANASLCMMGRYPDWEIQGYLKEGSILSIQELIEEFVGPTQDIPDLSIFECGFNVQSGSYAFDIGLYGSWIINGGINLALTVEDLRFSISSSEQGTSAYFSGSIKIASIGIYITADYDASPAQKGWQFSGGTPVGQLIPMGELIAYLTETFSIGSPPKWIEGITLQDLKTDFNTVSKNFDFAVTGNLPLSASKNFQITVAFSMIFSDQGYTKMIAGSFAVGSQIFKLVFSESPSDTEFSATWTADNPNEYLQFEDIAAAFGFTTPQLPPELDLSLRSASFLYNFTNNTLVLEAESANYGKATFVALKNNQTWQFFFGLAIDKPINFAHLPLLDGLIPPQDTVEINEIQIAISSAPIDATLATQINALIQQGYPQVLNTDSKGMQAGLNFAMNVNLGGTLYPVIFAPSSELSHPPEFLPAVSMPLQSCVTQATSSDGVVWFTIQKTFGPISFQKIGLQYKDNQIIVLVNASLSSLGLKINLLGLGVGSSIKNFDPVFHIQGIEVTYANDGIEISGGLLGTFYPPNFIGELILSTEMFSIAGLAGYTSLSDHPSLFLYAVLNYPIGGPAFCFVTGLAAGFGYNRNLLPPDISGVSTFPLVQWAMDTNPPGMDSKGDIGAQVAAVLTTLSSSGVVAPLIGRDWLAIGLRFTSFELIDSFALLTFTFGTQFEIDLLGLSRMSLPTKDFPIAYAELAIKASFRPSDGYIGVVGQLTPNSYIFTRDCHLTGGFAYCCWFTGPHAGDIVITLGGYSRKFTPPQEYPMVPRLGLSWQVDSNISIQGNLYYALTSCAVMAGGSLSAVWNCGGISAWFDVEADFLIVFIPFHYYMEAGVDLGASFSIDLLFTSITMTIHLGVDLAIWGPDFSGTAEIDLYIISFTIDFGAGTQHTATTIAWADFYKQLLPHAQVAPTQRALAAALPFLNEDPPAALIQIKVIKGLNQQLSNLPGDLNCLVDGEQAQISVSFAIPLKGGSLTGHLIPPRLSSPAPCTAFGVGPTGTSEGEFASRCAIHLTPEEEQTSTLAATPILQNVPTSLWKQKKFDGNGVPVGIDPLHDTTIENVLVGYTLAPSTQPPDHSKPLYLKDLLYETDEQNIQSYTWSNQFYPVTDPFKNETVAATIMSPGAQNNRTALIKAIIEAQLPTPSSINVRDLASDETTYLLAPPQLSLVGESKGGSG